MWPAAADVALQGGPWVLCFLLVALGWLIPLRTHNREIRQYERAISALEATVSEQRLQLSILLARLPERTP